MFNPFRPSRASITRSFDKAVKQLDALHRRNVRKAAKHDRAATHHTNASRALDAVNQRALAIRHRLAAIVA